MHKFLPAYMCLEPDAISIEEWTNAMFANVSQFGQM
jgi:hypothetical protein